MFGRYLYPKDYEYISTYWRSRSEIYLFISNLTDESKFTVFSFISLFLIPFEMFIIFILLLDISMSRLRFFSSKTSRPFFIFSNFPFIFRVLVDMMVLFVAAPSPRLYITVWCCQLITLITLPPKLPVIDVVLSTFHH